MGPDLYWVLVFSLGGIAMGLITSLVGLPKGAEFVGWLLFYTFYVAVAVLLDIHSPFWTVLVGSLGAGFAAGTLHTVLMRPYRRNNPWYEEHMQGGFLKTAAGFYAFAVLAGLVFGFVAGGLAWLLSSF